MNNPAERLFTVVPGSGEDAQRIVRANDAHFTSFVSGLLSTGWETTRRGEIALIDPNTGKLVPVEALAAKMLSDVGELTAIVTILHDRTEAIERNQLYEQLKLASEELEGKVREATGELANQNELLRRQALELEQASAAKSQFLANVSHELRTPLNAILGYAAMTLQGVSGELSAPQRRNLSRIDANARHLLTLINEILDITRIEAGRMPIQIVAFNLPELVREVTTELEPIIAKSGLQVISKLPRPADAADRPAEGEADSRQPAEQRAQVHAEGQHHHQGAAWWPGTSVSVAVIDTGIGIPKGDQREDLRRLPPGRQHAAAGLRWHGSWFVDLPAADDDAEGNVEGGQQTGAWVDVYADPAGELTEVTQGRDPAGMKDTMATKNKNEPLVLVVDDFADAREMYGEYLKFCGFRVAEAQNGVEAIDKAKRLKPDLILMDLSMPVVDGWEATRRLKADASTKGIPVVALTGHAMTGHSESAKSAGCDVVITKPCLPARLDQGDQEGDRRACRERRQIEAHQRVKKPQKRSAQDARRHRKHRLPSKPRPGASRRIRQNRTNRRTHRTPQAPAMRWNPDPEDVQRSVVKLVLSLIEFIRKLMERQAIRRLEEKTLTPEEIENVGIALMKLEQTVVSARQALQARPEGSESRPRAHRHACINSSQFVHPPIQR